jgi:hypothetical protein
VVQEEGTFLDRKNWSDRFGIRSDRFGVSVQRDQSDRFGGSRVTSLVFMVMAMLILVPWVVVQVVGMVVLVLFSMLETLHLMLNTRVGGVITLSWREGTVHGLPFMAFVLLQRDRGGSLVVLIMVVHVAVVLGGEMLWIVLTPLWSKWLGTRFTLLVQPQCRVVCFLTCLFLNFRWKT